MTLKTDITKNTVSEEWLFNHFCIYLYLFKYELSSKWEEYDFKATESAIQVSIYYLRILN